MQEGQRRKRRDRQGAGIGEDGQREHMDPGRRVGDQHHPKTVESIRKRAAKGSEDHIGGDVERGDDGEPGGGMCQLPGRPRHRDHLDEETEPGEDRADGIDAEIPVRECVANSAEPSSHHPRPALTAQGSAMIAAAAVAAAVAAVPVAAAIIDAVAIGAAVIGVAIAVPAANPPP